jgi:hypothetical protein
MIVAMIYLSSLELSYKLNYVPEKLLLRVPIYCSSLYYTGYVFVPK